MAASDHLQPRQFLELHHGTNADNAQAISQSGMTASYYERGNPSLTSDPGEAEKYARSPVFNRGGKPAVVTVHIPGHQVNDYLHEQGGTAHQFTGSAYALRQPLPPSFVHNVRVLGDA